MAEVKKPTALAERTLATRASPKSMKEFQLKHAPGAPLEVDPTPLTHGTCVWLDGEASAKYAWDMQISGLAVDLYTLSSEVLMDRAAKSMVLVEVLQKEVQRLKDGGEPKYRPPITIAAPHLRYRSITCLMPPSMATASCRTTPATIHRTASLLLMVLALLLVTPRRVSAQSTATPSGDGPYGYSVRIKPGVAALVIALICGFFFLGFFAVYLHQCGSGSSGGTRPSGAAESRAAASRAARRGLDPEVLASFPTMAYAEAKEHKKGKGALECAVCLSEFADDDTLRLLPRCCHVFHVDCIDVWLGTHVTCPVCRANLAEPEPADAAIAADAACESTPTEDVGATVEGDLEGGWLPAMGYRRWHSTGHKGEEVDRYTLRLPEHVRQEIFTAAGLRRAASVAEARARGEASGRRGYGGGRSGRWGFLLRTFSVRRRADGTATEGSSKRVYPSAGAPLNLALGVGGGGVAKSEPAKEEEEAASSSSAAATERV
ncbi:hypothetical protein GW17_00027898 [Ensete ventricosum]|nr:hypothetical protein GW17_00027898 [Ensete ventricosum]